MSLPPRRLLAGAALLVLIGLVLRWSPDALSSVAGPGRQAARNAEHVPAVLADSGTAAQPDAQTLPSALPGFGDPPLNQRSSAAAPRTAAPTEAAPAPDLAGIVLDHLGRPLPGITVRFRPAGSLSEFRATSDLSFLSGPSTGPDTRGRGTALRTSIQGTFLFAGCPVGRGGTLSYGEGLVHGPAFTKEVEAGETWQELHVPDLAGLTSHVVLKVTSAPGGLPIDIEEVEFLLAFQPKGGERSPRAERFPPEVSLGRVDAWLGVGSWDAVVTARAGERRAARVIVRQAGIPVELTLELAVWPDAHAEVHRGAMAPSELPNFDVGRGLAQYIDGVARMGYGAERWDLHFLQTLSFGTGPVKAATLTLRLKSISGMSSNDGIYLEYQGERQFLWSSPIQHLPGTGEWNRGESATVLLDLAQLPLQGETVLNLLPALEDGLLDVVIQDDTAVLDMDLRVVR